MPNTQKIASENLNVIKNTEAFVEDQKSMFQAVFFWNLKVMKNSNPFEEDQKSMSQSAFM